MYKRIKEKKQLHTRKTTSFQPIINESEKLDGQGFNEKISLSRETILTKLNMQIIPIKTRRGHICKESI